jgi:hypothetical protein
MQPMTIIDATQQIERLIINRLIDDILATGSAISVNDGEETVLKNSTDKAAILAAMFSTDEDYLITSAPQGAWIRLIYGNGVDVISDHAVRLSYILEPVQNFIDAIDEGLFDVVPAVQS